jgi:hypothetical protein
LFDSPVHESFKIVEKALESGKTSIQELENKVVEYTYDQMQTISEFMRNIVVKERYNYSSLSWDFYEKSLKENFNKGDFITERRLFSDEFLLRVGRKNLIFTLFPDTANFKRNSYQGSIRSITKSYYCPVFAKYLNGGGHGTATGFTIEAESIAHAIATVEKVIADHIDEYFL